MLLLYQGLDEFWLDVPLSGNYDENEWEIF